MRYLCMHKQWKVFEIANTYLSSSNDFKLRIALLLLFFASAVSFTLSAQELTAAARAAAAGDTATTVITPAKLSAKLTKHDVRAALRLVADWQLQQAEAKFNQDWTFAPLYEGFLDLPPQINGTKYRDAILAFGKRTDWKMGPSPENANDQAIGRAYIRLYLKNPNASMLVPARERTDHFMHHVDNPDKLLWHWCDALFMGPPVFTAFANIDHNKAYLDFMDHEWWLVSDELYSEQYHLYFRDKSYFTRHEANGKPMFWSRGNGWVIAALAQVLSDLPNDYPSRSRYIKQFKELASSIAALQGSDGLWRASLLDAEAYPAPETSGTAMNLYGIAWGINHGMLDRKTYLPVVESAWAGLLSHVYADGRLGAVQPIGQAPDNYPATSSYVYGVGAYLMAGSQVYAMAK